MGTVAGIETTTSAAPVEPAVSLTVPAEPSAGLPHAAEAEAAWGEEWPPALSPSRFAAGATPSALFGLERQGAETVVAHFSDPTLFLSEPQTRAAVDQLLRVVTDLKPRRLLVDLARVTHLTYATLVMLLKVRQKLHRLRGRLGLAHVNPGMNALLETTRLKDIFDIIDTI